jgi:hypothetical protein
VILPLSTVEILVQHGASRELMEDLAHQAKPLDRDSLHAITEAYPVKRLIELIRSFRTVIGVSQRDLKEVERLADPLPDAPPPAIIDRPPPEPVGPAGAGANDQQEDWQKELWADKPWKGGK